MGVLDSDLDMQPGAYTHPTVEDLDLADDASDSADAAATDVLHSESDNLEHRKRVRRLLEQQLERRRLKKEMDLFSDWEEEWWSDSEARKSL